jgi:hypothetical protein
MPILKILVDVPSEIMKGLSDGLYTRDAAGIIRWAKGTGHAGEIVVHLREIGSSYQLPQPIAPNFLFPMGAFLAVQLAGFAYLRMQLKQIGAAITSLQQDVSKILRHVEVIREQQYLDRLNRVAHGVEHLVDAEFRPGLLHEAQKSFGKARAEIRLFLEHQSPVALVEYLPQTELLLQGLSVSFAGEYMCLHKQRAELVEISHVCHRYGEIMSLSGAKLLKAPPIHKPPIQSARYLTNFSGIRPLRKKLIQTGESIAAEEQFVTTLAETDTDVEALDISGRCLLAVYP